jgi:hypothetical protein
VAPFDQTLIRSAVELELARGGQVYFLHNRVDSIWERAHMIQQLVPAAKIAVGHGQMAEQELEKTITPKLNQRAMDETHLALVREQCRKSVAEFVKAWLMKEDYWRTDGFSSIIVRFPDEEAQGAVPAFTDQPTIRLENVK